MLAMLLHLVRNLRKRRGKPLARIASEQPVEDVEELPLALASKPLLPPRTPPLSARVKRKSFGTVWTHAESFTESWSRRLLGRPRSPWLKRSP
jgi:hypothetical protein